MTGTSASTAPRPRPAPAPWPIIAALAVLECLALAWFLAVPLPHAAAVGGRINRANLLWKSLPALIPGVTWPESHLGAAVGQLSHVENLPDRLPILLAAGLIAGAAVALGRLGLRAIRLGAQLGPAERLPLAFALGAAGLGALSLATGRFGLLAPGPVRIGLGALILAELGWCAWSWSSGAPSSGRPLPRAGEGHEGAGDVRARPSNYRAPLALVLVVGPFLVLMLLGAMVPTIEFDALEYHLQGPKEYFLAGRIAFLPHNVYTSMPSGVEMLTLLGMEALGDWWRGALAGQVLVMLHAPAAAALVACAARRWGSPRAGWVAAVVYLTAPWIDRLAVTPFVEGPLCLYHAALLWVAAWMWGGRPEGPRPADRRPDRESGARDRDSGAPSPISPRTGLLAGLLAGGAMAIKYPALVSAVLPFGAVVGVEAMRRRSWRIAAAYALGVAALAGPWLARNAIDTGNPVYPLATGIFGSGDRAAALVARWAAAHGPRPATLDALRTALLDVAGRSDWQSPLFLALAPLAVARPGSRRVALGLWAYAAYLFATWWLLTHRVDRFWIPMLPALGILAGLGADWTRSRAWAALLGFVLTVGVASNLVFISTDLAGSTRWTDDLATLRTEVPAAVNPPLAALDAALPEGAKVLLVGQAGAFHVRHPLAYNTVFDRETIEAIARGPEPGGLRPAGDIRREFRRRGITHVYVDWAEIARYRRPGNYGYSEFVAPGLFERLVAAGVLEPVARLGPAHELYRVR